MKSSAILLVIAAVSASAVRAQPPSAPVQQTPTAEALALARTLVEKSGVGGQAAMTGLIIPPPGYIASLGVTQPQQVQAVTHDAVMPTLGDHADALTDIQVKSYATLLSVPEMKAAIAFFDSPAGQNLAKFRGPRIQGEMAKATALIAKLEPEITAQASAVAHAHGWPGG